MADWLTPEQRRRSMSANRSKGNRTTELPMVALLRKLQITGWRRRLKLLPGRPERQCWQSQQAARSEVCVLQVSLGQDGRDLLWQQVRGDIEITHRRLEQQIAHRARHRKSNGALGPSMSRVEW